MHIVFDIGGTNMRVSVVQNGKLGEITKVPTPKEPTEGVATFTKIVRELSGGKVEGIFGSFAGTVDAHGVISNAKNLTQYHGHTVGEFGAAFGVPVLAANDGIVVGLGELRRGAGRGFGSIAYITVSTGVGGAFVKEGADIYSLPLLVDVGPKESGLESQISGTAVQKKFGIPPKELDSLDERNKLADILAAGLAEVYKAWKPEAFVIGGSMITGVNPIPLERVREIFTAVPIKMAELGDSGGLIGGMILAETM